MRDYGRLKPVLRVRLLLIIPFVPEISSSNPARPACLLPTPAIVGDVVVVVVVVDGVSVLTEPLWNSRLYLSSGPLGSFSPGPE